MKGIVYGMGLKIQDKFNHTDKFGELSATVGNTYEYFNFKVLEVGDIDSKVLNTETGKTEIWSSQILWNKLFY